MYGCEWDDETGATDGFHQRGYDGKDYYTLDLKNMRWIAAVPQAFATTHARNNDQADLEGRKNYLTQICVEWLKKYVSVFQKDSSSPVVCHATGFFPRGIMVTWQRDGEEVQEDVELGMTQPNGDGNFQITSRLTVKPEDTHTYTCTVQHKSLENDIIKPYIPDSSGPPMGIIIGCVVGVLVVALAVIGVVGRSCRRKITHTVTV
ncbi:hypothetical protein JZ751_026110 [Albula glossodonta]|uniref:Ig-like domain-containing protein n=1 Tax=Albula glossodonta TaxID=121402 RepID=A0A8T2MRG0_9TELE|nr:hypothetical protein JZ751_026110 [Albula glossodonta]